MTIKQYQNTQYYISDTGDVFRKTKNGSLKKRQPICSNNGYQYVTIHHKGEKQSIAIHRLVLHCFGKYTIDQAIAKDLNGMHLDDDPTNNHISNLRWGTRSENELMKSNWRVDANYQGINNKPKKYGDREVNQVKQLYDQIQSFKGVSEQLNIPYTSVWNMVNA